MDWLDLPAVQGTLKSFLQHYSSKASILCCSAFIMVQLSHTYMTTGKNIALTIQTFVGKSVSLFFLHSVYIYHSFSSKKQVSFNFMAAVTICSDFEAQENSLSLFPIFPIIRVFSNESVLWIRWPKDWSFSFSISPSNGYSGLISFSVDWFDLLAVQRTLKSLLQHHSSKASILRCSAFFIANSHIHTWLLEKP